MTYKLLIGQRGYSSWSLRGWLPFAAHGIPYELLKAEIYGGDFARDVAEFGGGTTVPAVVTPEGGKLTDSLAIGWHLAEAFPDRGLLPEAPGLRAMAMSMICEMHSGFSALRSACPMNLFTGWHGMTPSEPVLADLARIEHLWTKALDASGGPFLFGDYSLADAFYAPVAMRIAGYHLPCSDAARAYIDAHLAHLPFRQWRAMAHAEGLRISVYDQPFEAGPFPAPDPIPAEAVESGTALNTACPYSGDPVTHLLRLSDGRIIGFCNAFCRDKTVADPGAWPKFTALAGLG